MCNNLHFIILSGNLLQTPSAALSLFLLFIFHGCICLLHKTTCDFKFIQLKLVDIDGQVRGLTPPPHWKQDNASLLEVYLPAPAWVSFQGRQWWPECDWLHWDCVDTHDWIMWNILWICSTRTGLDALNGSVSHQLFNLDVLNEPDYPEMVHFFMARSHTLNWPLHQVEENLKTENL